MGGEVNAVDQQRQSTQILDDTTEVRAGEKKRCKKSCSPIASSFFPPRDQLLQTSHFFCFFFHTFKFIISLLSSANLELHEKLEGELRLEKARWG